MIYRSKAVSKVFHFDNGSRQIDEQCAICERELPGGSLVLRKKSNDRVICILCVVEISEV